MVASTLHPTQDPDRRIYPAMPNWLSPLRETYEFKTDVMVSDDGSEQRMATRNSPRRFIEFQSSLTRDDKRRLDDYWATWLPYRTLLPDFTKQLISVEDMKFLADNIKVRNEPFPDWVQVGVEVILAYGAIMETRVIGGLGPGIITFFDESIQNFPIGTRIHPRFLGRVGEPASSNRVTNTVATFGSRFEVEPGSEIYVDTTGPTYLDYREVFMKKPNWQGGIDMQPIFPRETVDVGFGVVHHFAPRAWPSRVTKMDFVGRDHRDSLESIDFFIRQKGRRNEFLMPTWEEDIPFSVALGNTNQIIVRGSDFAALYKDHPAYKQFVFRMKDGTYVYGVIDDIEALVSTNASAIILAEPLPPRVFTSDTVWGISWLLPTRLASDKLDIDWITDRVCQYSMSFQSLEETL